MMYWEICIYRENVQSDAQQERDWNNQMKGGLVERTPSQHSAISKHEWTPDPEMDYRARTESGE